MHELEAVMNISRVDLRTCQVISLERMVEPGEVPEAVKLSLSGHLRLILRRSFNPSAKRRIKGYLNSFATSFSRWTRNSEHPTTNLITQIPPAKFNSGDRVLVKSRNEIQLTLNHWNELRGCSFLPEMWQYCGTTQTVLKPVNRFVDERDCRVKKLKDVYLLEEVNCQGFELYGKCDRNCFYFWRAEWLSKIDEPTQEIERNG
jgi:hypothetical protein